MSKLPYVISYEEFCSRDLRDKLSDLFRERPRQAQLSRFFRVSARRLGEGVTERSPPAHFKPFSNPTSNWWLRGHKEQTRCICGNIFPTSKGFFLDALSYDKWEIFESKECIDKFAVPIPGIHPFQELTHEMFEQALLLLDRPAPSQCSEDSEVDEFNADNSIYYSTVQSEEGAEEEENILKDSSSQAESDESSDRFIIVDMPEKLAGEEAELCSRCVIIGNVRCSHSEQDYDLVAWSELYNDSVAEQAGLSQNESLFDMIAKAVCEKDPLPAPLGQEELNSLLRVTSTSL